MQIKSRAFELSQDLLANNYLASSSLSKPNLASLHCIYQIRQFYCDLGLVSFSCVFPCFSVHGHLLLLDQFLLLSLPRSLVSPGVSSSSSVQSCKSSQVVSTPAEHCWFPCRSLVILVFLVSLSKALVGLRPSPLFKNKYWFIFGNFF